MDLMPIQSINGEPEPMEGAHTTDLTGFGELIDALLAGSEPGAAAETSSPPDPGVDPDSSQKAAQLPVAESRDTTPNSAPGHDITLRSTTPGPIGDGTTPAPPIAETAGIGDERQRRSVENGIAVANGMASGPLGIKPDPGVTPLATTERVTEGGDDAAPAPIETPGAASEMAFGDRAPTATPQAAKTSPSPTVASTTPPEEPVAPALGVPTNPDGEPSGTQTTGSEPDGAQTDPEPPAPVLRVQVDGQAPDIGGEVPARAAEIQAGAERAAMAEVVDRLKEWADRVEHARQPDSISLKLADPDGEVLIRLAMRDGRLEMSVTRPGGETPSWLLDQLDDALTRRGFDLSGGDPGAEHASDRWRGEDQPMGGRSRSKTHPNRREPDRRQGLWI